MLTISLPARIEKRLDDLEKATGRPKTSLVREAVIKYLDDLADIYLA